MILLKKGEEAEIVLSLTEKTLLGNPFFLFQFTNDITGEEVKMILTDTSSYQYRYNQFFLDVDTYFLNSENGFWTYHVYEKAESNTIIPETGLLEIGKMRLDGFALDYTDYTGQNNDFITYNS